MVVVCSENLTSYFNVLETELKKCYDIAKKSRANGIDPELNVEILISEDMADRVEKLVGPKGIAQEIRELSKKYDREEISLIIAKKIVNLGGFETKEGALEQSIRTGLAILTEGVLVAPLEGIARVEIKKNDDGTDYVAIYFSGPIRSAGGTGQALSVLIADVVRRELNIGKYKPTPEEVERYKEEIPLYKQEQHLQYTPAADEIVLITSSCPVCIDGEGTEDAEVSGNRDLPRVETNNIRGGACLVIAEGLCSKASKIQKHVKNLGITGWEFIDEFLSRAKKQSEESSSQDTQSKEIQDKYMREIIAGRPIFSYPATKGGFRLRYGRGRTMGLAALAIHPATMYVLGEFLTIGTQMKIEYPGKATAITPCDTIEGPTVLLKNGSFMEVNDVKTAKEISSSIKEIIDVGEILIPFGEFIENNKPLLKGSYSPEWWLLEVEDKIKKNQEDCNCELLEKILSPISPEAAFQVSEKYDVPLHPKYNLFWHDVSIGDVEVLSSFISERGRYENGVLTLPVETKIKDILIELGATHEELDGKIVIKKYAYPLIRCCGLNEELKRVRNSAKTEVLDYVSQLANVRIRERAPTRIGGRMGRPEKSKERKMKPPVHVLFPVGSAGGPQRLVNKAADEAGNITVDIGYRECVKCRKKVLTSLCSCGGITRLTAAPTTRTADVTAFRGGYKKYGGYNNSANRRTINLREMLSAAQRELGEEKLPNIKGVRGLSSTNKTPESLAKGILRAKHDVFVFRDGTIRYDMTDVPLTHFKPWEIHTSVDAIKKLGYTKDYLGNTLENDEQILELKIQDIVISKICGEYMIRVSKFIDDLLVKKHKIDRFYNIKKIEDLLGHLVIGLAPHTSAGVLGRIIGYTNSNVGYAHPFFHAAKRRNCDGDEDCILLLLDGLLNFSRSYIPNTRGALMDSPLVLTPRIDPKEIDKEAHNLDVLPCYPLELYEASARKAHPKEVEQILDTIKNRVGSEKQYEDFGFTHDTANIAEGPVASMYGVLEHVPEKVEAQLSLGKKIRAVDENDVARRLVETHLLPDIIGNLSKFSKQNVRCSKCGTKYRRVPLKGVCTSCGGNLTLTIHMKSVIKYLGLVKEIGGKYTIPNYTKQRILLIEKAIDSMFKVETTKKPTLDDFI